MWSFSPGAPGDGSEAEPPVGFLQLHDERTLRRASEAAAENAAAGADELGLFGKNNFLCFLNQKQMEIPWKLCFSMDIRVGFRAITWRIDENSSVSHILLECTTTVENGIHMHTLTDFGNHFVDRLGFHHKVSWSKKSALPLSRLVKMKMALSTCSCRWATLSPLGCPHFFGLTAEAHELGALRLKKWAIRMAVHHFKELALRREMFAATASLGENKW